MTRIQIIRAIGDLLTRLDVLRGSLLPGNPERLALDLRLLGVRGDCHSSILRRTRKSFGTLRPTSPR